MANGPVVGALCVAALVAGALLVPLGDRGESSPQRDASPLSSAAAVQGAEPSPAGGPESWPHTTDEGFCAAFLQLVRAHNSFVSNPGATAQLKVVADAITSLGIPASMTPFAVGGWVVLLGGIYDEMDVDRPAGSFLDDPAIDTGAGAQKTFSAYLTQYCPA